MSPETYKTITMSDLSYIRLPYVIIAGVIIILFVIIALAKLPGYRDQDKALDFIPTVKRLFKRKRYYEGIIAQFFYVGAQITVWTFIIHYAVSELGFSEAKAQAYNIAAMVIFVSSRFVCTFFLKYVSSSKLLLYLAIGGHDIHRWNDFPSRDRGFVFVSGYLRVYVTNVSNHLWNCPSRNW
jgi:FHS family L-fucose permease-like MFS transporter